MKCEMKGTIVVYSIKGCPHCIAAKNTLQENGLAYVDVGLDIFPNYVREWVAERTGRTSVPQIFFNNVHVGGNQELQDQFSNPDQKDELLNILSEQLKEEDGPPIPHPSEAVEEPEATQVPPCQKDELVSLLMKGRKEGIFKVNRKGYFCGSVRDSVRGSELSAWLSGQLDGDLDKVRKMVSDMMKKNLLLGVDEESGFQEDSTLYRTGLSVHGDGLNTDQVCDCEVEDVQLLAKNIRSIVLQLLSNHLSKDGKYVDYQGMSSSPTWKDFLSLVRRLQRANFTKLTSDGRLAFFINIYNVLVIHGIVLRGFPSSLFQKYRFFSTVNYIIGGFSFSLNEIENGVLRRNRGSMGTLYRKPFRDGDARLAACIDSVQPGIHFALNCGAKSCPPIKTFSEDDVKGQLSLATIAYLEDDDSVCVNEDAGEIKLSQLFNWYAQDFGETQEEVLQWIILYLRGDKREKLTRVVEKGDYKVSYLKYDWGTNEKS